MTHWQPLGTQTPGMDQDTLRARDNSLPVGPLPSPTGLPAPILQLSPPNRLTRDLEPQESPRSSLARALPSYPLWVGVASGLWAGAPGSILTYPLAVWPQQVNEGGLVPYLGPPSIRNLGGGVVRTQSREQVRLSAHSWCSVVAVTVTYPILVGTVIQTASRMPGGALGTGWMLSPPGSPKLERKHQAQCALSPVLAHHLS